MNFLRKVVEYLENVRVHPVFFLFLGEFWAVLRMFLEDHLLSLQRISYYMYTHGISTFTFTFFAGTYLLSRIAGTDVKKTIKLTGTGYFLLILPPVIDRLWTSRMMIYKYADPVRPGLPSCGVIDFLFTLEEGFCAGPGIRIEMYLIGILSALYVFVKRKRLMHAFAGFVYVPLMFLFVLYQEVMLHRFFPHVLDSALYFARFMRAPTFEKLTVFSYLLFAFLALSAYAWKIVEKKDILFSTGIIVFYAVCGYFFPGVRTQGFFEILLAGFFLAAFFLDA